MSDIYKLEPKMYGDTILYEDVVPACIKDTHL